MEVLDRVDAEAIRALRERGEFFWLDLVAPADDEVEALQEPLEIAPLALEDSREFGQRAKIDSYGDRALIVFYGVHGDELVEVHLHVSGSELVTIRRERCAELDALRERARMVDVHGEAQAVHAVLDRLTDTLAALVGRLMAEVDRLEEIAFESPSVAERRRISSLRSELFRLRQVASSERDMLANGGDEAIEALPGLDRDAMRHPFRDVHDHLALVVHQLDYAREVLAAALDVFLSTTSNRLSETAARLTLVATIVLPLTLITGFFGQNFGWLVRHIDSFWSFLVLGVGGMVVPALLAVAWLARASWLKRG